MSQHHGFPGPAPAPGSTQSVPGDSYASQRRRTVIAQPPSITTNFLRVQGSPLSQTPITAISTTGNGTAYPFDLNTPVAHDLRTPRAITPASSAVFPRSPNPAMEPYNPRQWSQSRQSSGSQMVYGQASNSNLSTREASGMEGMRSLSCTCIHRSRLHDPTCRAVPGNR